MNIEVDQTPRWLDWSEEDRPALEHLKDNYTNTVCQGLGRGLASLLQLQPERGRALLAQWESLDDVGDARTTRYAAESGF